jgi:hypothetical protein
MARISQDFRFPQDRRPNRTAAETVAELSRYRQIPENRNQVLEIALIVCGAAIVLILALIAAVVTDVPQ